MSGKRHNPQEQHSETADGSAGPEAGDTEKKEAACDDLEARARSLEAEIATLREELSATNDKYLRKLADDVNFRKRMAREKEESQRYAVATLLGDIIPILDDFDRAIASAEVAKDYAILHDGVALIRRQFGQVLETKYGLVRLEAVGKAFDPNRHEAVAVEQGDGSEEPMVSEEFLPGYALHDRVLRTAKVRVRMPAARNETASSDGGSKGGAAPSGPAEPDAASGSEASGGSAVD